MTRITDTRTHCLRMAQALLQIDRTFGPSKTGGFILPADHGATLYAVTGCRTIITRR